MPPVSVTIFASDAGNYFLEDDGIPGNNFSRIRFPNSTIVSFEHPTDDLFFAPSIAGVVLTINLADSLGTSRFSTGNLTDPSQSPESIRVRKLVTTAGVTMVANLNILESASDSAADIVASTLLLSAVTGIGTAANALETQVGTLEAETGTGGINIRNFGTLSIGGLSADVAGLSVATSGNLLLENFGAIVLSDDSGPETIHGGTTSGNVTLIANGVDSDIISNVDQDAISAPSGNISLTAGRDIGFGLIGANFDNDVRASGSITFNTGRDFLLDGFADVVSDDFGQNTGGNVIVNAGRNIALLAVAGTDAGINASGIVGADVILNTGPGGTLTLNSGNGTAPFASIVSNSGDAIANADRISIGTNGALSTPAGQVTLRPVSAGWAIDLGSATDVAFALELSDAELDRIFTPSLAIGGSNAGPVTVTSSISPLNALDVTIQSGNDITVNGGVSVVTGGDLTLKAGNNILLIAGSSLISGGIFTGFVDVGNGDPGEGGTAFVDAAFAQAVRFFGGNDGDTLMGGANNDSLDGSVGADTMIGRLGNDTYAVDDAGDVTTEALGEGIDTVKATLSHTLTDNLDVLTLLGGADLDGTGNSIANTLNGNSGDNTLDGAAGLDTLLGNGGNDTLLGGSHNDLLNGGAGNDTMNGGTQNDTVSYDGATAGVTVALIAGAQATGGSGSDTLVGIENLTGSSHGDTLTGNNAVNVLIGGNGNDTLNGLGGNDEMFGDVGIDTLVGGAGRDLMTGGASADTFDFNATSETGTAGGTRDQIIDFVQGSDRIDLVTIDASTLTGGNQAFAFIGAAAFGGVAGQLRAIQSGANTVVSGDVNGDSTADFSIQLNGVFVLNAGDFVL